MKWKRGSVKSIKLAIKELLPLVLVTQELYRMYMMILYLMLLQRNRSLLPKKLKMLKELWSDMKKKRIFLELEYKMNKIMIRLLNKDKFRRSLKTYKSKTKRKSNIPENRFVGYAIPFNPKPIKIYNESSCTSQKYAPSTISTKGLAISRIRQNLGKIQLSKEKEND